MQVPVQRTKDGLTAGKKEQKVWGLARDPRTIQAAKRENLADEGKLRGVTGSQAETSRSWVRG